MNGAIFIFKNLSLFKLDVLQMSHYIPSSTQHLNFY